MTAWGGLGTVGFRTRDRAEPTLPGNAPGIAAWSSVLQNTLGRGHAFRAANVSNRLVEQAPDSVSGVVEFVLPQTVGRSLLMEPIRHKTGDDATYESTRAFWRGVLDETLVAERFVRLEDVAVFEWFPRNPGLFHTERAASARREAQRHIRRIGKTQFDIYIAMSEAPPDHASIIRDITTTFETAPKVIFTPRGKMSMLEGGIGCVRYNPVEQKSGGVAWFMSATSTLAPDEGIPLLVPNQIYQRYLIDQIKAVGFAPANVTGRLRFIPKEYRDLYSLNSGIPRLYLEVDDFEPVASGHYGRRRGQVSVAASFVAEIDGVASIYAAYVTFDPGYRSARPSAIEWMRDEYVQGMYKGTIVTDFDQQSPSFSDTLFSLNDVMTSTDLAELVMRLRNTYGRFDWSMLEQQQISFALDRSDKRVSVSIGGNATGMILNINATLTNVAQTISSVPIDPSQKQQLQTLVAELKEVLSKNPTESPETKEAIATATEDTIKNASQPQPNKVLVKSSLSTLMEIAKNVAEALPTVTKIAGVIGGMLGF
jgi:hypothetical protein